MARSGSVRKSAPQYRPDEFMTEYEEWLAIQNGAAPKRQMNSTRHRDTSRREETLLGVYPLWSCTWLGGSTDPRATPGSGTDPHYSGMYPPAQAVSYPFNPYSQSKTQGPAGATFGLPYVQALLAEGISNSTRAAYWQKYFVHRAVRPEAYGGLAHHRLANGVSDYPLHDDFLKSEALGRSKGKYGTYLLSQTYPEAAPIHSTYPGGATSVGAVTATLLKAFFDKSRVVANPVQPDPADPTRLVPYSGPPLTVAGS